MGRSGSGRREKRGAELGPVVDEGAGHRHARLQDLLQRELESLLRDELEDPRLQRVRIASLVLSVDYRHARVHYTLARDAADPPLDPHAALRALEHATPFMRRLLAGAIDLKRVPELRFVFDGEVPR